MKHPEKIIIIIIIIMLIGAYYLIDYYNLNNSPVDELVTEIHAIENAATIDESLEAVDKQLKNAISGFTELEQKAKSPIAVKFIELTASQNQLAINGQEFMTNLADDIRYLENFNWETNNEEELEILQTRLDKLCPKIQSYQDLLGSIISIIDEKIILSYHPDVQNELFDGDSSFVELLIEFRDSQKRIMEKEKSAYQMLCVTS
jgi:hypothetical protein